MGAHWDTEERSPGPVLKGEEQHLEWGGGTPSRGEYPDQVQEREARRENEVPCFFHKRAPQPVASQDGEAGASSRPLARESSPVWSAVPSSRLQACHQTSGIAQPHPLMLKMCVPPPPANHPILPSRGAQETPPPGGFPCLHGRTGSDLLWNLGNALDFLSASSPNYGLPEGRGSASSVCSSQHSSI